MKVPKDNDVGRSTDRALDTTGGAMRSDIDRHSGVVGVIEKLNPFQICRDFVIDYRKINLRKDEARRFDERERSEQEHRHIIETVRVRRETYDMWLRQARELVSHLPAKEQPDVIRQLLKGHMTRPEAIAGIPQANELYVLVL